MCPPPNPFENLANAIVIRAAEDYRLALRGETINGKPPEWMIADCESFFLSEYFHTLTKVSGKVLIEKLRKEYIDECHANPSHA